MRAFLAALAVALTMCAASQSKPETPWRVGIATTGGITGRGTGTFSIASDGTVSVTTMANKTCSYRAADEDLARFEKLLAAARPSEWKASYAPENRCCDRIEYTLTLDEGDQKITTEWIDDPLPRPADLIALAEAIIGGEDASLRRHYGELCR